MRRQITIGRDKSSDIVIGDSTGRVSRNHATLHVDDQRFVLDDHSSNGTSVNGKKICHSSMEVQRGDRIVFGKTANLSWRAVDRLTARPRATKSLRLIGMACTVAVLAAIGITVWMPYLFDEGSHKAENCNCRIFSLTPFDWEGNCVRKYADGTGWITWHGRDVKYHGRVVKGVITGPGKHYVEGGLVYEGEFQNGAWHGYGTRYYPQTNEVYLKGFFKDGEFRDETRANNMCQHEGMRVVNSYFDGGVNINASLYSISFSRGNDLEEILIDLTFKGQYTNIEYACRVRVANGQANFLECNDYARGYLMARGFLNSIL